MKKYLLIISVCCGLFFLWSCKESFLDRNPLDKISPTDFFNTSNDLKVYANRFYLMLPSHGGSSTYGGLFYQDGNSDNMIGKGAFGGTDYDARLNGTRLVPATAPGVPSSSTAASPSLGQYYFGNIAQVNYGISQMYRAQSGTTVDLNHYRAELKFFRAYFYFDLVKNYGNVSWVNKPLSTDSPDLFNARDPRNVVIDSILADLDFCILNLYPKASIAMRVNKECALQFKARVCLYEGTWEKYHSGTVFGVPGSNGTAYIQMAATTAKQLMDMGTASIYKGPAGIEYWDLFNKRGTAYDGNPEVLLYNRYDRTLGRVNAINRTLNDGSGNVGVTKWMIDSYLCDDGLPISVSPKFQGYSTKLVESTFRDPRFKQSIQLQGTVQQINNPDGVTRFYGANPPLTGTLVSVTGWSVYKGVSIEYDESYLNSNGYESCIIFRYAEDLLIYAEALAELGTITQADLDKTVNVLRARVGMFPLTLTSITTDPNWDFPTLSPIINEVRRERRVELAFEGLRLDDLMRWRAHSLFMGKWPKGAQYSFSNLAALNPTLIIGTNWYVDAAGFIDPLQKLMPTGYGFVPERDYLNPIPTNEIQMNPDLKQNPGW